MSPAGAALSAEAPSPRQLTDEEAFADDFARFQAREMAQQVLVEDTGQTVR